MSTLKVDTIDTSNSSGNITVSRPLSGSGASLTALNATNLASGTVATARLGSGTANNTVFLRGDGTWATAGSTSASDLTSGTLPIARIADDAITLAKMAPGTDGNIISYDASGNPVAIATGNDGQVLTSTGAGSPPAFENAAAGGDTNWVRVQKYTDNYNSSSTTTSETLAQTITFTGLTASTEYLFLIGISWGATGDSSDGYTNQAIISVRHGGTTIYTSQGASVAESQQTNMSFNVVPYNYTTTSGQTTVVFTFYIWVSNASYTANMFFNKTGHVGSVALENNITAIKV